MVECFFCKSKSKESYIFTQCSNFICLDCASAKWDKKFSIKCSNQVTYLNEDTINALNCFQKDTYIEEDKENQYIRDVVRENLENFEQSYCQSYQFQESAFEKKRENKPQTMFLQAAEQKKQATLKEMEKVLNQEVAKVKETYDNYRREVTQKQQSILKYLYNSYSDHLSSLKPSFNSNQAALLREKLQKISEEGSVPQISGMINNEESGRDKILQKLDYNQQKMKQKLHRHYQMLK